MELTVVDTITAAYEQEHSRGPQFVTTLNQVPPDYAALTPEWLTAALCRDVPGAAVTEFRLDLKDDGSSNRRRIFLSYNEQGTAAGLPASIFCKAAENLANRIMLGVSGASKAEADFYTLVRHRLFIEAPRSYYAGFDPKNNAYFIAMHDMADDVTFPDDRTVMDWDKAVSLVNTLAGLHARFYESRELGTEKLPFKTWPRWWTEMISGSPGFGPACDQAFGDAQDVIPARLFRRRSEVWPCTLRSVERHNALPRTLIHSDVHLKNWYITSDGVMGLHDWQIVAVGHWSRDLVYAVTTALTVEQRRAWWDKLVDIYIEKMGAHGVTTISVAEANLNGRQQLLTALAFWTITLRPAEGMPDMQPERTTYEYIKRLATAIDDMDSLDSFGR